MIPEREVFECVRGDSMSTSLDRNQLIAHTNARMMIFGDCCPDGETQVQTIPKQVLRIQFQPREQIVEVPTLLHFEQLFGNPQF